MKARKPKSFVKQCTGIALASMIGCSGIGVFATSVSAAENTNPAPMNQSLQAEVMTITQLQDAIQHKNDPFINQVKNLLINTRQNQNFYGESEYFIEKRHCRLTHRGQKNYSNKINRALVKHFREVPKLLKLASPEFKKKLFSY